MLRTLIMLLLIAGHAQAGPWPREKKSVFLSLGSQVEISTETGLINNFTSLYAEYGLTNRLTLGLDVGGDNGRAAKAIGFLRLPVFENPDRPWLYAVELGVGQEESETAIRPGFTVGRGLNLFKNGGWFTFDTRLVFFPQGGTPTIETDVTVGVNAGKKFKIITQLQAGMQRGNDLFIKFAPSVVYEHRPGQSFQLGALAGVKASKTYGISFNIWRSF